MVTCLPGRPLAAVADCTRCSTFLHEDLPLWLREVQRTPWRNQPAHFHVCLIWFRLYLKMPRYYSVVPRHARAPLPPSGLDINNLSELALSQDGKRLIVTNADDKENVAVSNLNGVVADRGAPTGTPALDLQAPSTSSSSSARNVPPQPLLNGQYSASRVAVSSFSSSSSSRVPLVRRRHMALLLRFHGVGGGGGNGGVDTPTSAAINDNKVSCVEPAALDDSNLSQRGARDCRVDASF